MDNYIKNKITVENFEDNIDLLTVSYMGDYKVGIVLHYDLEIEAVEQILIETSYNDNIINEYDLIPILSIAKEFLIKDKPYNFQDLLSIKNKGMSELDKNINKIIFCIVFLKDVNNMLTDELLKNDYESLTKELKDFYIYLIDLFSDINLEIL